jgi:hypothetical protein
MGIIEAGNAEQRVVDEISPIGLEISDVNAAYDQASEALGQARLSGDPELILNATVQKTSLGLVKSNIGTIKFVRNTSILEIVLGAGLVLAGVGLLKRD